MPKNKAQIKNEKIKIKLIFCLKPTKSIKTQQQNPKIEEKNIGNSCEKKNIEGCEMEN